MVDRNPKGHKDPRAKTLTIDVNRELPPLPTVGWRRDDRSSASSVERILMPPPPFLERSWTAPSLPPSPSKSRGSCDESKDGFKLAARHYIDSLQPAPLQIPIRNTDRRQPQVVVSSSRPDDHREYSREVPVMLVEDPVSYTSSSPHQNAFRANPGKWATAVPTEISASSSYSSPDPFTAAQQSCECQQSSNAPCCQGRIHLSRSEGRIETLTHTEDLHEDNCPYRDQQRRVHFNIFEPDVADPNRRMSVSEEHRGSPNRGGAPEKDDNTKLLEDPIRNDEEEKEIWLHSPKKDTSKSPHKKLFGENGWLGRTPDLNEQPNEKWRKSNLQRMGEKLKQVGEWVAKDNSKSYWKDPASRFELQPGIVMKPRVAISLDPHTQARVYSDVELMICTTANKFLIDQLHKNRMSTDSVKKIIHFWQTKNRAQVAEFQFDQSTQRHLVEMNFRTFQFPGEYGIKPVILRSTLNNWRVVAREMSIRTFCYPDSVVRKHMHDTYRILEMLGASDATMQSFEEIQVEIISAISKLREKNGNPIEMKAASLPRGGRPSVDPEYHSLGKR